MGADSPQVPPVEAAAAPIPGETGALPDVPPAPAKRRSRSGTSGAARARRAKQQAGAEKAPRRPTPRRPALGKRIADTHLTIALGVSMVPQPWALPVSMQLAQQADSIGSAWEALAREQPRVAETLERLLSAGTVAQLLAAYLPVIVAAAAATGRLPAGGVGGLVAGMGAASPAAAGAAASDAA